MFVAAGIGLAVVGLAGAAGASTSGASRSTKPSAAGSLAAARQVTDVPVAARFVSFTWWKTYTCHLEFGVAFANVPNAVSYSIFFNLKGYGPQKLVDLQPSPASDHLLALGKVPGAGSLHFDELGGNGTGGTPKSSCVTPTENGYSVQYSKLRVTAKLTAGQTPRKENASVAVAIAAERRPQEHRCRSGRAADRERDGRAGRSERCRGEPRVAGSDRGRLRCDDHAGSADGFLARCERQSVVHVQAKSSKTGKVEIKVTATGKASTGAVSASARTGFLVKRKAYAIEVTGIERTAKIGPLPKPLSPDKVAFGDTVDFALSGWNPDGGPIAVSWGDKSLGKLTPNQAGAADGELKIKDFQTRGTRTHQTPCTGKLTATQGDNKGTLTLRSEVKGVILVNDKTKSTLKTGDVYCEGEYLTHPSDFDPAGGALIYTAPWPDNTRVGRDSDTGDIRTLLPPESPSRLALKIDDDETSVHIDSTIATFRSRVCVRLASNRWVVITVPGPGEITANDHSAPCLPNAKPPHSLVTERYWSDEKVVGVSTITTATYDHPDIPGTFYRFPQDTVFTHRVDCHNAYIYVEGDISFPKGVNGDCHLFAQGDIEVVGPIRLSGGTEYTVGGVTGGIPLWASGDEIFWGSVH